MIKSPFTILIIPWLSPQTRSARFVPEASDCDMKGAEQPRSPENPRVMRIPRIAPQACNPSSGAPVATPPQPSARLPHWRIPVPRSFHLWRISNAGGRQSELKRCTSDRIENPSPKCLMLLRSQTAALWCLGCRIVSRKVTRFHHIFSLKMTG